MSNEAPLFIQLYTDEHISPLIAQTLRRRGFVAQSAIEIGMIGRGDEEHLTYAADHSMAVLTFDHVDFVRLAGVSTEEWNHNDAHLTHPQEPTVRFGVSTR